MNKIKKEKWMGGVFAAALLLQGISASAVHITLEGGTITLPLMDTAEETATVTETPMQEFGILGRAGENYLIIGSDTAVGYLKEETLAEYLPDFTLPEDLLKMEETLTVKSVSDRDPVMKLQQALINLGYLQGTADGMFGGMSAAAVSTFQEEHKLEVTGLGDPITAWLAEDLAGLEDVISYAYQGEELTVEEKFSAIAGQTTAYLEDYLDWKWKFTFDPFEQTGILDPRITLGSLEKGSTDMDRMSISVALKVRAVMDYMLDEYVLVPAFEVTYRGSSRPNITGAQFNVGNSAAYLTDCTSQSTLEGIHVVETAYISLDGDAVDFLKDENNKNGILRIICQDSAQDVPLDLTEVWCRDVLTIQSSGYDYLNEAWSNE